jgi:hypothetical protein
MEMGQNQQYMLGRGILWCGPPSLCLLFNSFYDYILVYSFIPLVKNATIYLTLANQMNTNVS